ncbi:MAG: hypothetical protein M1819_003941 [Sarea resinae]|nr:MAG: hypothetical protein M1819_003941 [Sarea resinae]
MSVWRPRDEEEVQDGRMGYPPIEPLKDFDWATTEPLQLRPFKPRYNLTMALQSLPPSSLLQVDKTYLARIELRKSLMASHPATVLAANSIAKPAIDHFYAWLMGVYLPGRFPQMFTISERGSQGQGSRSTDSGKKSVDGNRVGPKTREDKAEMRKGRWLKNLVTGDINPLDPPDDPVEALRILGETVDEDFLFLLPDPSCGSSSSSSPDSPSSTTPPPYTLQAYVTCFPSGFSTPQKFGLTLADIHAPVPGYAEKLQKSMDRFFGRLEVGRWVWRANWTITPTSTLFAPPPSSLSTTTTTTSTTTSPAPRHPPPTSTSTSTNNASAPASPKTDTTPHLRVERQTLHRIPLPLQANETSPPALLFAFHTYTTPIRELSRDERGGLLEAVRGLESGNVRGMAAYKGLEGVEVEVDA